MLSQAMSHMLCIGYGRFPPQNLTDLWLTIFRCGQITMHGNNDNDKNDKNDNDNDNDNEDNENDNDNDTDNAA